MGYTLPSITDADTYIRNRRYGLDAPTRRGAHIRQQQDLSKVLPQLGLDGLPINNQEVANLGLTQEELASMSPYANVNKAFVDPLGDVITPTATPTATPTIDSAAFASAASPYMNMASNMNLVNPVFTPPAPVTDLFSNPEVSNTNYPTTPNGYRNIGAVSNKVSAAPGSFLSKMFHVESRNGTLKDKPGNSHTGIGQMGPKEIASALKGTKYTSKDYANNVDVQKFAAEKWSGLLKKELVGRKINPTDFNMWLGWNLGGPAAKEILNGKVSAKTLSNIRNQAGMNKNSTVEDYLAYYRKLF